MNPGFVRAHLRDESLREGSEFLLRERRQFADGGRRVVKDVELQFQGETRRWREDVRMYELPEVRELARDVGLRIESEHGAFDATPFSERSPRMLLVARRT
jgi:hypothetical protein